MKYSPQTHEIGVLKARPIASVHKSECGLTNFILPSAQSHSLSSRVRLKSSRANPNQAKLKDLGPDVEFSNPSQVRVQHSQVDVELWWRRPSNTPRSPQHYLSSYYLI